MKVTDFSTHGARETTRLDSVRNPRSTNDAQTQAGVATDRVKLSALAAEIARARQAESPVPAQPARLEALREAVRSGTLEVDTEALSQSVVDEDIGPATPLGSGGKT
jgi:flagellar biosynthesis anti-sigma factor FlgM